MGLVKQNIEFLICYGMAW